MERLEFLEDSHTYLLGGVIVPSVSEILQFIFPNKYSNIPDCILKAKASFGTAVHEAIEFHEQGLPFSLTPMQQIVFEQYLWLKEEYKLEVVEQETIVHYKDKYCGRLDMIANINGKRSLVDIKTTAKLDEESLSIQLGLYALAYGEDFDGYYVLWLPKKDIGRLIEIKPKSKEELFKIIEDFERSKS